MGNSIFPSNIKGLNWDVKKTPQFSVIVQTPANLRNEVRVAVTGQPQYKFDLSYEFLRQDPNRGLLELDAIEGFFKARGGNFDSFLVKLSDLTGASADSSASDAPVSQNGDGGTKAFQLMRMAGGFKEVVDAVDSTGFQLYVGGVLQSGSTYVLNAPYGWVTFNNAPANGAVITWTGTYYYRCRFNDSLAEFNLMQNKLWELQSLSLLTVTT